MAGKWMLIALVAAALTGCKDRGACLESHERTDLVPQYTTGCIKTMCTHRLTHFVPVTRTVCDRWEFPEGRATKPLPPQSEESK